MLRTCRGKQALRLFALALLSLAQTGWADLDKEFDFNIAAQPMDAALLEFSEQADIQLVVAAKSLEGIESRGVRGRTTAESALTALLNDTGLRFNRVGDSVTVTNADADVEASPGKARPALSQERKAQTSANRIQESRQTQAGGASSDESPPLEEIVVTGSRLRRFGNGPSPVVTFDDDRIKELGITDIADVLDYLPQSSFSLGEDSIVGGAKPVQLRGLSFGTTLLLINGRRVVTSAAQGNRNFFDLNTIPLAAVQRVEVLSESASAVYGADAIGGVVNVILKDFTDTTTISSYYGGSDGGGEEFRASAISGFESGPVRLLFGADYFDRSYLRGDERERFFNQDYTRFGGPDYRSTVSSPGNVFSLAGPLPGLSSNQAGVPGGTDGVGLTPGDFAATEGPDGLNRASTRRFNSVIPESRRASAFFNAEVALADDLAFFSELLYSHRDEARQMSPTMLSSGAISNTVATQSGIFVPPGNPFNPFGAPVSVNYLFEDVGPREEKTEEDFYRIAAGLRGAFGDWNYELSVLHTQDDSTQTVTNEVDPERVVAALSESDPATALNLFADGPSAGPEVLASLVGTPSPSRFGSDATQVGGFVAGPLFALPAGSVEFVVGGEWREEKLDFVIPSGLPINLHAERQARAVFVEVLLPLINEEMSVPLAHQLRFTAAARYDHYSDFSGTTNPKLGMEWRPVSQLLLRGTWGTSFRAPALFELYFEPASQIGQFPDPLRPPQFPGLPGELVTITLTAGGNPDLEAEEAESFSIGAVYEPAWIPELEMSVDYFNIEQDLRVQSPDAFTLIENADLFPDRVTRAPRTAQDIAAGLPGTLLALDVSRLNLGSVSTDGVDMRIRYRAETAIGVVSPSLSATHVNSFEAADFPGQPLTDRVGKASRDPGTVPEWKAIAGISWSRDRLQSSASFRFVDSYQDVNVNGMDLDRRISSQWYLDLNGSYRFEKDSSAGFLNGTTLRIGAINVLDRDVPYSDVNIIGYDPSQADIRGRFVYGSISKEF